MKIPKNSLYFFSIASATAWELLPLYKLPNDYYTSEWMIWFENWTGVTGRPYACGVKYSPSPVFVFLVLLPALILFALYLGFKEPIFKKSSLSTGLSILSVVLFSLVTTRAALWILLITAIGVAIVLGRNKTEKALLVLQGSLPGFLVLSSILMELHISC